jgi:very-short-patch-repair endonuclease
MRCVPTRRDRDPDPRRQRSTRRPATDERTEKVREGTIRSSRESGDGERNIDRIVGQIADADEEVVTHDELRDARLGDEAIKKWLRRGRLIPRHRGVYLLAHDAVPQYADEMAAVKACRPRSLIGGHSGAYMWGYRPKPPGGIVDVIVIDRKARSRPGIRVHRMQTLMKTDLRHIGTIPVVSPALALLQIASDPGLTDYQLELALHEALALKRVTIADVKAVLKRYPRHRGCARLRKLADPSRAELVTDSKAAERLRRELIRAGMPPPRVDKWIGKWRPDLYWEEAALAVEVDGRDFHSSLPRLERDHRKDAELATGKRIEVQRFTGRMVRRELGFVLVTIARMYERRLSPQLRDVA